MLDKYSRVPRTNIRSTYKLQPNMSAKQGKFSMFPALRYSLANEFSSPRLPDTTKLSSEHLQGTQRAFQKCKVWLITICNEGDLIFTKTELLHSSRIRPVLKISILRPYLSKTKRNLVHKIFTGHIEVSKNVRFIV